MSKKIYQKNPHRKQLISILYLLISIGIFGFAQNTSAALIVQAPKYIGLTNGLVGYWSFDGKDMAGFNFYRKL